MSRAWILAVLLTALPPAAHAQELRVGETIEVARVIIDAHVLYDDGSPVLELEAKDFRVRIDRKLAEIESIEWISALEPSEIQVSPEQIEEPGAVPTPRGRLIVMFFQTDFQRARVIGQVRMIKEAKRFLETLTPDDRVAVVSFDSHLKLRQDFTSDTNKLIDAIESSIKIDDPSPLEVVPEPSLRARLSAGTAKESETSEEALFHLGNALLPVPGPKTLLLFGWGLGRYSGRGIVSMEKYYAVARTALEASRTTVFTLDISDADFHSLEVGLKKVSKDTGGLYQKTHIFTKMAMDKVTRAISGHYVLVVRKPELPRGSHAITVEIPGRRVEILARTSYRD